MVRLVLYSINSNLQFKQNNGHRERSEAISLSHGLWFNKLTISGLTSILICFIFIDKGSFVYMKVVIAPDSFKECMSAKTVAECIRDGILQVRKDVSCIMVPMADGGEGTVQALVDATKGEVLKVQVEDPLGRPINSFLGILGDRKTSIIEMAAASGLELLKDKERNPLITSTYGTGQLILAAIQKDCKKIIVGIGGSATNDGGAGMMQALGIKLLDKSGKEATQRGLSTEKLDALLADDS